MKLCQMLNARDGRSTDVYGIVSTGQFWEFGKLTVDNHLYTSEGYALTQADVILGIVDYLFTLGAPSRNASSVNAAAKRSANF